MTDHTLRPTAIAIAARVVAVTLLTSAVCSWAQDAAPSPTALSFPPTLPGVHNPDAPLQFEADELSGEAGVRTVACGPETADAGGVRCA